MVYGARIFSRVWGVRLRMLAFEALVRAKVFQSELELTMTRMH